MVRVERQIVNVAVDDTRVGAGRLSRRRVAEEPALPCPVAGRPAGQARNVVPGKAAADARNILVGKDLDDVFMAMKTKGCRWFFGKASSIRILSDGLQRDGRTFSTGNWVGRKEVEADRSRE